MEKIWKLIFVRQAFWGIILLYSSLRPALVLQSVPRGESTQKYTGAGPVVWRLRFGQIRDILGLLSKVNEKIDRGNKQLFTCSGHNFFIIPLEFPLFSISSSYTLTINGMGGEGEGGIHLLEAFPSLYQNDSSLAPEI